MRNYLLLTIAIFALCSTTLTAQRDTIVAWTFPTGVDTIDVYPNAGLPGNASRYIAAEDTSQNELPLSFTNGSADFAVTATDWNDGENNKFWSIKFKADGYKSFQVSSKQRGGGNNAGPMDWKLQYRMSGDDWADVSNGSITCGNDWTTGVVEALDLSTDLDDPGSTSIYLRWIMTSNISINNTPVEATGTSKIDDVIITGLPVVTNPVNIGDTIAAWTFPTGIDSVDIYANAGLEPNLTKYISAEDTTGWPDTNLRDIYFTNGVEDKAATATGWDNGAEAKLWAIKFKATGYTDLKISSKQRAAGNNPGPKDWKIQVRFSGEDWIDVPNGTITCANDWTTGVAEALPFPAGFENPGTTSMYIRWIMTSNDDINGDAVTSDGISKIDDVVVSGTSITGVEQIVYASDFKVYPNPTSNYFNIETSRAMESVSLYNMSGQLIKTMSTNGMNGQIRMEISTLPKGLYLVHSKLSNYSAPHVSKLIVQ